MSNTARCAISKLRGLELVVWMIAFHLSVDLLPSTTVCPAAVCRIFFLKMNPTPVRVRGSAAETKHLCRYRWRCVHLKRAVPPHLPGSRPVRPCHCYRHSQRSYIKIARAMPQW
jgi:hypothetical protein